MCVILHLSSGVNIKYELLENAVFNNWHGFGLILRENNRMEVIRRLHEGGTDPQEVAALLEDNQDVERTLHLRFNTAGKTILENQHPFTTFYTDRRHIEFMHNGTLHDFKPMHGDDRSDTRRYAEEFLGPLLRGWVGENGKGDIQDPMIKRIIEKQWSHGSKGILVCNDLDPLFINRPDWKTKGTMETGGVFLASNDDYFERVTRGPEFEARKKRSEEAAARASAQRRAELEEKASAYSQIWPLTKVEIPQRELDQVVTKSLPDIFQDMDLYDDEGLAILSKLTLNECEYLVRNHPSDAASLFLYITDAFTRQYKMLDETQEKHERASKRIAELIKQLKELRKTNPNESTELVAA